MITDGMKTLIGKKYYQLSRDEKLIVSDIFKTGRKHGFKLIVNLPSDADEDLKKSLQNGVWGIREMEHKDAIGLVVQVEKNMKAARIYQRVSTKEQNLERQNALIEQAKAEGYYIAGVYKEKASGVRADRPVLNQLIADLQEGDVIITEHIDRISRLPLAEAEKLVARIREKGAFLSIPGIIDLSQIQTDSEIAKIVLDSIQTMLLKIALQTARDDYEQRRNRQAAGIAEAKKQGLYKGRQANIQKHKLIVSLRQNHTLQETAALAGCSVSLVKVVMRQHKQSQIPKEE